MWGLLTREAMVRFITAHFYTSKQKGRYKAFFSSVWFHELWRNNDFKDAFLSIDNPVLMIGEFPHFRGDIEFFPQLQNLFIFLFIPNQVLASPKNCK
jgi:hypothetical protein